MCCMHVIRQLGITTLIVVAAFGLMALSLGSHSSRGSAPVSQPAERSEPEVVVVGGDASDREMLHWALGRFTGLSGDLPDIIVTFDLTDDCGGHNGFYTAASGVLEFCNRGEGDLPPRQTMLHELAHAWSFHRLDAGTIERFIELRELGVWADTGDVAWWQTGQEQAAEILAWGLMGDRPFVSKWVRWEPCADLIVAFRLLTDREPDRPLTSCRIIAP